MMKLQCIYNASTKYTDNTYFLEIQISKKGTKGLKKGPFLAKKGPIFMKSPLKGPNAV